MRTICFFSLVFVQYCRTVCGCKGDVVTDWRMPVGYVENHGILLIWPLQV